MRLRSVLPYAYGKTHVHVSVKVSYISLFTKLTCGRMLFYLKSHIAAAEKTEVNLPTNTYIVDQPRVLLG